MTSFNDVNKRLRKKNRGRYALLASCCFVSVLLITAYISMMGSETVLSVLPEGGDSRKQMMMIFALAVIGCGVFTTYAAGIFFREKSRETGIFLALGATRKQLARALYGELTVIGLVSCGAGALLGMPFAALIWQGFRLFIVDSDEMALSFDLQALLVAGIFALFVLVMLFWMGRRSIRKTNIIDVVQESHKSEPIRAVPRWYGWGGMILAAIGAVVGFNAGSFFVVYLHWYPPGFVTAPFYLPLFIGLYMMLLHTVANGWGRKKKKYRDIISVSMMKFQARQTVRNMLVMTLLIAGAYFGAFYSPMFSIGALMDYNNRPIDYMYFYRNDQDLPGEQDVEALANKYDVTITDFNTAPMARLGVDGMDHIETEGKMGTTYEEVYTEVLCSNLFMPEAYYNAITGETADVKPGTVTPIMDRNGDSRYMISGDISLITNTVTNEQWPVETTGMFKNDVLYGHYVLDDADYATMTEGLSDEWLETLVCFNVIDVANTYDFADALFHTIVASSGPEVEIYDAWDPVEREKAIAENGAYAFDNDHLEENGFRPLTYDEPDSTDFRTSWQYMPRFGVLDKADFVKTTAVYMLTFVFIAIICFAAVFVIAYTRCLSVAMTNQKVYDDLRHLGAPKAYLLHSARSQVRRVFATPALLGTVGIYCFYSMIMFFNDNRFTQTELLGLAACGGVVAAISLLLWLFYRLTVKKVYRVLKLEGK